MRIPWEAPVLSASGRCDPLRRFGLDRPLQEECEFGHMTREFLQNAA
jgi:hypothetical protein